MKYRNMWIWPVFGLLFLVMVIAIGWMGSHAYLDSPEWEFIGKYNSASVSPFQEITEYDDGSLEGDSYGIPVTILKKDQVLTIQFPSDLNRTQTQQLILAMADALDMEVPLNEQLDFVNYLGSDLGMSDPHTEIHMTKDQGVIIRKFIKES